MTKIKDNIELSPTEEVVPLNDVINQELIKHNLTEAILTEMETAAAGLEIQGTEDKENYEAVNKLRIAAKNTRVMTTKVCKAGREQAIAVQKSWISKEKEIVTRIEKVEDSLAAKQKVIDDIKAEQKRIKDEAEQVILQERSVKLIQHGCVFIDNHYVLDDIRISVISVKSSDDFTWSALFAAVETKFKEKEAIRLEEEKLKEQAAATAKLLAEQNLAKEEELRKKQLELEAKQKAIEEAEMKQKLEAERLEKERLEVEKRQKEELLKSRKASLFALGFAQQNQRLSFKDLFFTEAEIVNCAEEEWNNRLRITSENVNHIKAEIEKQRLIELEKVKREAAEKEREKIELENQAKALLLEEARLAEEKRKKDEELENARLAALRPDEERLTLFLKDLANVPLPNFNSDSYKEYSKTIEAMRKQFLKHIFDKKPL